jgi:hypothetical protein
MPTLIKKSNKNPNMIKLELVKNGEVYRTEIGQRRDGGEAPTELQISHYLDTGAIFIKGFQGKSKSGITINYEYQIPKKPGEPTYIKSDQDKLGRVYKVKYLITDSKLRKKIELHADYAQGLKINPNPPDWKATKVPKLLGDDEPVVEKKPVKEKVLKKKPIKEESVKIGAKEIKAIHEEDNYLSRRCIYSSVTTDSTKANSVSSLVGAEKRLFEKGALEYDTVSKKYNLTENGKIHSNLHVYLSKALYKGNFKKVAREIEEFLEARM